MFLCPSSGNHLKPFTFFATLRRCSPFFFMEENLMPILTCQPNVERDGHETVITFTGSRNRGVENPLAGELERVTDNIRKCHLWLDFINIEFVTGVELGTLVNLHKKLRACGGRLTFLNLNANVYEVFLITQLHTIFDIYNENTAPLMPIYD
jgi:anti-anti-sigma factor